FDGDLIADVRRVAARIRRAVELRVGDGVLVVIRHDLLVIHRRAGRGHAGDASVRLAVRMERQRGEVGVAHEDPAENHREAEHTPSDLRERVEGIQRHDGKRHAPRRRGKHDREILHGRMIRGNGWQTADSRWQKRLRPLPSAIRHLPSVCHLPSAICHLKMIKKLLLVLGALVVLAAGVMVAKIGPRNIIGMIRYDQRRAGDLKVGDRAPDALLVSLAGRPERFYIINPKGVIVYKGEPGPFGYHPEEVEAWLAKNVGA